MTGNQRKTQDVVSRTREIDEVIPPSGPQTTAELLASAPLDHWGLPISPVKRELVFNHACVVNVRDAALVSLAGSFYGITNLAKILNVSRYSLRVWFSGVAPIPVDRIPQFIELARQQSRLLADLAVRLETVDLPVLQERRRIVNARRRQRFFDHMGYWPEENQVMRRARAPGAGSGVDMSEVRIANRAEARADRAKAKALGLAPARKRGRPKAVRPTES